MSFRYRLAGFDRDWVEAGARRVAYYTNLPSGTYTFEVTAANEDGVWSPEPATVAITLTPPFWSTWWFRSGGAVILAGLVLGLYRLRVRHLERERRTLERLVAERTAEAGGAQPAEERVPGYGRARSPQPPRRHLGVDRDRHALARERPLHTRAGGARARARRRGGRAPHPASSATCWTSPRSSPGPFASRHARPASRRCSRSPCSSTRRWRRRRGSRWRSGRVTARRWRSPTATASPRSSRTCCRTPSSSRQRVVGSACGGRNQSPRS
ncbi:MAG: triple tyrosine motif-containing protein [Thermoanaerobaculaceae bacterium]